MRTPKSQRQVNLRPALENRAHRECGAGASWEGTMGRQRKEVDILLEPVVLDQCVYEILS